MAFADRELIAPRRGALVREPVLRVEGVVRDPGRLLRSVSVSIGGEAASEAALEQEGDLVRYVAEIDVSRFGPRLRLEIQAESDDGSQVPLHETTVWRPDAEPARRRAVAVFVEAEREGARVSGVVSSAEAIAGVELRSGGVSATAELGPGGRFEALAGDEGPVELWARHQNAERAPTLLGVLDQDGVSLEVASPEPFTPLETFTMALAADRQLSILRREGTREDVSAYRLTPAGADWGLTIREGDGFRTEPLGAIAALEVATKELEPLGPEARAALKTHLQSFDDSPATLASDDVAPIGVALPVFGLRPPPSAIERVILVRPGDYATDELYVREPLAPLLTARGVGLELVTLEDEAASAEAARSTALDDRTVVVVSRSAGPAWLARLAADPKPFVVYLMDDDPLAAFDAEGLPHRYRRRMIELVATDFAPLLRRCDRLLVSSPRLAKTFASRKTVLLEPPFVRPPPSLAHLDDLSEIRIVYHATDVHRDDFEFLAPALERLLKDRPQARLELVSGLPAPGRLARLPNFERVKPMDWADYKAYAARRPAHVSLAPMLGTPFNAAKSVVKLLDAASLGAVGVYSDVEPYDTAIRHDVDGLLLDNDPPVWRRALAGLTEQPKRLKRLALAGQAAARERSLDKAREVWTRLLSLG